MKSAIKVIRNILNGMNSRWEAVKEQINDLKDTVTESNEAEQKRERIMEHEKKLRELSNSFKRNNILVTGVPEEQERKGGRKFT